jgi:hypothetical protein
MTAENPAHPDLNPWAHTPEAARTEVKPYLRWNPYEQDPYHPDPYAPR